MLNRWFSSWYHRNVLFWWYRLCNRRMHVLWAVWGDTDSSRNCAKLLSEEVSKKVAVLPTGHVICTCFVKELHKQLLIYSTVTSTHNTHSWLNVYLMLQVCVYQTDQTILNDRFWKNEHISIWCIWIDVLPLSSSWLLRFRLPMLALQLIEPTRGLSFHCICFACQLVSSTCCFSFQCIHATWHSVRRSFRFAPLCWCLFLSRTSRGWFLNFSLFLSRDITYFALLILVFRHFLFDKAVVIGVSKWTESDRFMLMILTN